MKLTTVKKANGSKLKEAAHVYCLQSNTDQQGSKIPFTELRWIGPNIIEKVLPNNNYRVHKIGTNKMQVLHRMRMRQFAPHQSPLDKQVTPPEWRPGPEVRLKHNLYARTWGCEYKKPIFDAGKYNATPPYSPDIPVQSNLSTEETLNTPGTAQENSPEHFPQTEDLCDVTFTYPYMEPNVGTSSEQRNNSPTNPRSSKYNLRHNPKLNCNDDYR